MVVFATNLLIFLFFNALLAAIFLMAAESIPFNS